MIQNRKGGIKKVDNLQFTAVLNENLTQLQWMKMTSIATWNIAFTVQVSSSTIFKQLLCTFIPAPYNIRTLNQDDTVKVCDYVYSLHHSSVEHWPMSEVYFIHTHIIFWKFYLFPPSGDSLY